MTGTFGSGAGGSAPRGQSLLRSFLAARSFPPRPPGYVLNRAQAAPRELTLDSLAPYWPNTPFVRRWLYIANFNGNLNASNA